MCYPHLKFKGKSAQFSPLVVQPEQRDSVNGQDPVSWYQPRTPGCGGVRDHRTDEDAFHSRGSVLEDDEVNASWHSATSFNPT